MSKKDLTEASVLRVVLPASLKADFQRRCMALGQNMSERARQLIVADLQEAASPVDRLSAILASADKKVKASDLPEPSIEDIDAFIDEVRSERISKGHVA